MYKKINEKIRENKNDEEDNSNKRNYSEKSEERLFNEHKSTKGTSIKIISNLIDDEEGEKNKDKEEKKDIKEKEKEDNNDKNNQNKKIKMLDIIKSSTMGERIIRLYFIYNNININENYFIDIENTCTFEEILNELANIYDLSNVNDLRIIYKGKELKKKDQPIYLDIQHGAKIFLVPINNK